MSALVAFVIALVIALFRAPPAHALEDARVLPKGRTRLSFIYAQAATITQTFGGDGQSKALAAPYNVPLNANNLKVFDADMKKLIDALNATGNHYNAAKRGDAYHGMTKDPGDPLLGDAISAGAIEAAAQVNRQVYNLVGNYGVSDQLSVALVLPLVRTQVHVNAGLNGDNTAEDIYKMMGDNPGVFAPAKDGLDKLRSLNLNTLQGALVERGYQRFESSDETVIGDIMAGSRYCYLNRNVARGGLIASVQGGLTIPTGRTKRTDEVTRIDAGQGAWDLGAAHLLNYTLPGGVFTVGNGLHYTRRVPGNKQVRVRKNEDDFLPDAASEETLGFKMGDKMWATLGAKVAFTKALNVDFGYEWAYKATDTYDESRAGRDTAYLSQDSSTYLETAGAGISYSTVPAFLAKKFPIPGDLSLNGYLPIRGRNAAIAPYATFEAAMYF